MRTVVAALFMTFITKGLVIFKTGYPVGGSFKGTEIWREKFRGYKTLQEIRVGFQIFVDKSLTLVYHK